MMEGLRCDLGHFPVSGPEGREKKLFYRLSEKNGIKMISGKRTPALLFVWSSNDVVQFGSIQLLSGGPEPQQTEYDEHPGEAVFHVLKGPMTFFCPDTAQTFLVDTGDFMFLPGHTRYKIVNYYGHTVRALFAIAPDF